MDEQTEKDYMTESVELHEVTHLDEDMRRLPGDLAYWNNQYAEAFRKHARIKVNCDKLNGQLFMEHREKLILSEGKATEKMIGAMVDQDETWHAARISLVEAEAEKVRLRGVCDAVIAKKDMMQSIGAKLRIEMANDPSIRQMAADTRLVTGA